MIAAIAAGLVSGAVTGLLAHWLMEETHQSHPGESRANNPNNLTLNVGQMALPMFQFLSRPAAFG